ncbi:YdeI family protein [Lentimicrobium sp. S6]|uniref:YdeI/OmpD-associated family protein n=1 Tax=Lentimicrobium sp. S6 TaxID=2735872 RepID=UPI001554B13B|nr:YdeI/OmpD-associated family protein [Lentimicrobium sp. S6]NPD45385.1 hypothetical protein [Lentimicrobium sp. S6]
MSKLEIKSICPANKQEWRKWLEQNHLIEDAVWLIVFKKSSKTPTISWSDAVDEALCFGWIDSVKKSIDSERYMQYYGKRKANSIWSKINKDKVAHLSQQDLIFPAGLEIIEKAKQNGNWVLLDDVEKLIIPNDLEESFKIYPSSKDFFLSLSKSVRKGLLAWIVMAKRAETREKRVREVAEKAGEHLLPKAFS